MEHGGAALSSLGTGRGVGSPISGRVGARLRLGTGGFGHAQGPQSGGWAKKSTPTTEGLGRSRGGFSTKLHAVVDALGNCLHLVLTSGHWADCAQLPALLAALPRMPGAVVADKAYNANAVLQAIETCNAEPVIPSTTSRNEPRPYDQNLYADRNKAERF